MAVSGGGLAAATKLWLFPAPSAETRHTTKHPQSTNKRLSDPKLNGAGVSHPTHGSTLIVVKQM